MANLKESLPKIAQRAKLDLQDIETVCEHLQREGKYTESMIIDEMSWFFTSLGLDRFYFETTPPQIIAQHIESLFAGKLLAKAGQEQVNQSWETIHDGQVMFSCHDRYEITNKIERRIDELYGSYRIRSYRSEGTIDNKSDTHFRLYFLIPTEAGKVSATRVDSTNIEEIGDENLLLTMSDSTKKRYQEMVDRAATSLGPIIKCVDRKKRGSMNLLVAYRRGSTHSYFSAIFDLLNFYGIISERSYVEQFKNQIILYSIHIPRSTPPEVLQNLQEDLSLVFVLPRTSLTPLFQQRKLTAQEVIYAYAAMKFACQFLTRYSEEYAALAPAFRDDPVRLGLLNELKQRLSKDTFTQERVTETIIAHPDTVKELYRDFYQNHFVPVGQAHRPYDSESGKKISEKLAKSISSQIDLAILQAFLTFNCHIQKTNFYRASKIALSFRLDPAFLAEIDYPDLPYAIFMIVGSEFRGFHVRFRNIARGGVRIIRSGNHQSFIHNSDLLFHECYHLAHTQQKKNKDIAEGGSKGAILLSFERQDRAEFAFQKYIDSLLDLMLPGEGVQDRAQNTEALFLGPDEGTADFMDWASHHARHRGYPFWKSFTTGKSVENGGIPHDLYGMTTHSVHQYVLGILEKSGLSEEDIDKLQTGGPDGDLGSNEIKISKDRTTSIVDGSGVLHDPAGLDRGHLQRLANARLPVSHFDRSKLSKDGYLVTTEDRDVKLPDGTTVENGLLFRNEFHLMDRSSADLFVPCGGRPNSVHINNVDKLMNDQGEPRFRFIVEGANLFFSPEARIALEQAGAVMIKDATANKGGVTSSSLEVLVALSLDDDEFHRLMEVRNGKVPAFYQEYVQQAKDIIAKNARLEFECIWRERQRTGTPGTLLSDMISDKINELTDDVMTSPIAENEALRRAVLTGVIPQVLQDQVGLDTIIERVPRPYMQAVFASHLASHYVYKYGLSVSETRFVDFLRLFEG